MATTGSPSFPATRGEGGRKLSEAGGSARPWGSAACVKILMSLLMFEAQDGSDSDRSCWPVSSALTARLRRLVTVYQRCNRKELPARSEMLVPGNHGYWLQDEVFRRASEMDSVNKEMQKR